MREKRIFILNDDGVWVRGEFFLIFLHIFVLYSLRFVCRFCFRVIEQSVCIQLVLNFLIIFLLWQTSDTLAPLKEYESRVLYDRFLWLKMVLFHWWLRFLIRFNCFYCWSSFLSKLELSHVFMKNHCAFIPVVNKIIGFNWLCIEIRRNVSTAFKSMGNNLNLLSFSNANW